MIIKASELQAAGMAAGNITGLGFDVVVPSGGTTSNFEIELKSLGINDNLSREVLNHSYEDMKFNEKSSRTGNSFKYYLKYKIFYND